MAEFVGESLHVVWFEGVGVTDDVEVGRCDRALTHTLAHQEEIIPAQITGRGERGEEERGGRREGGGGERVRAKRVSKEKKDIVSKRRVRMGRDKRTIEGTKGSKRE